MSEHLRPLTVRMDAEMREGVRELAQTRKSSESSTVCWLAQLGARELGLPWGGGRRTRDLHPDNHRQPGYATR